jgi:hypothetical protein
VSGTVTGLAGSGLVLQDNAGDNYTVNFGDASFTFATAIAAGGSYDVSVLSQPTSPAQICTVTNGTGTVTSAVTNVAVACVSRSTVGVTITGLTTSGLVLSDGTDTDFTVASTDTTDIFPMQLANGASYTVSIVTQPTGQTCTVDQSLASTATDYMGTISGTNVNVAVTCE